MIILSIFFLVTALIYSSVGFGGGSTYLALLLLWDVPYTIFPLIALACNIIVVSGNSFNYMRAGNFNLKLLLPYLFGSIPFAFIGGSIQIEKELFELRKLQEEMKTREFQQRKQTEQNWRLCLGCWDD